jgi:hypothetical protein
VSEIAARGRRGKLRGIKEALPQLVTLDCILGHLEGDDAVDDYKDQVCGDESKSGRTTREAPARACSIHIDLEQSSGDLVEE